MNGTFMKRLRWNNKRRAMSWLAKGSGLGGWVVATAWNIQNYTKLAAIYAEFICYVLLANLTIF